MSNPKKALDMVDPVGPSAINAARQAAAAPAPVGAVPRPRPAAGADEAKVALPEVARAAAATPPVDLDRVARIKKAVADGNFPIYPATIADRLIALRLQWNPHDAA